MKKNTFLFIILSALCLLVCGCGNHEVESESSSPVTETSINMISGTQPHNASSETQITSATSTQTSAVTSTTKTVSVTTVSTGVSASTGTAVLSSVSVTFKSPSGETEFKQITNKHAQYPERVPTVLKPHEPVIYTTAPASTAVPDETETTVISSDDTYTEENTQTTAEENTTETTTETTATTPEPVTPDELYFYGMTPGDDIIDLIGSFGDYDSMTYVAGEYRDDGVQAENRHYYFTDMELITFWYGDEEILGEMIVRDSTFTTARGISIGSTAEDVVSAYGEGEYDGITYKYQADTGYMYFHIDENGTVDYMGFHGVY